MKDFEPATADVLGGWLVCLVCHRRQPVGDVASYVTVGWPKCHGQTMVWRLAPTPSRALLVSNP